MICPFCEDRNESVVDMELIETVHDYNDPANFYGHGQYTTYGWECPDCFGRVDYDPDEDGEEVEIEEDEEVEIEIS